MSETTRASLIEFPAAFPVKALGRAEPQLRQTVVELVAQHADFDPLQDVREQPSRNGNFLSVTVTFTATDQAQLDAVYQALHDHELILMVF